MKEPVQIAVIENIPRYSSAKPKSGKRKIKEIMHEYGYDDDYIENINDNFCQGWDTAVDIIIKMLSDRYWKTKE